VTRAAAVACAALAACAPVAERPADAGRADVGERDAGIVDAGFVDAGSVDAGSGPAPGFGALSGACGVLDAELTDAAPATIENRLDFGADPYDDDDAALLTAGGQAILAAGNAGGSSLLSEIFAYEVLARCEGALLLETETTISYDEAGAITDLLVQIDGRKIGVSVVRAFHYPPDEAYPADEAAALALRKLADIQESSAHVSDADRWTKQILSVIAYSDAHADVFAAALDAVDAGVRGDTVVVVTVTDGADDPLY
jgi:hypothetical protein